MKTTRYYKAMRYFYIGRLLAYILFLCTAVLPTDVWSQQSGGLSPLKPKFATLRRARISPGLGIDFVNVPIELRTNGYDIYYDSTRTEWGGGINAVLDLFSPASLLGFYAQIGYHGQNFTVQNPDDETIDVVKTSFLQTAFQLKLRTGPDTKQTHGLFMTGFSHRKYLKNQSLGTDLLPMQQSLLSLVFSAGAEILYVEYRYGIRIPRTMLTLSYHHPLNPVFRDTYLEGSWGISNPNLAGYRLGSLLCSINFML